MRFFYCFLVYMSAFLSLTILQPNNDNYSAILSEKAQAGLFQNQITKRSPGPFTRLVSIPLKAGAYSEILNRVIIRLYKGKYMRLNPPFLTHP